MNLRKRDRERGIHDSRHLERRLEATLANLAAGVIVRDTQGAMVFANQAAHDAYQEAPRHLQFIAENKETWASVRVFDSVVE